MYIFDALQKRKKKNYKKLMWADMAYYLSVWVECHAGFNIHAFMDQNI